LNQFATSSHFALLQKQWTKLKSFVIQWLLLT